MKKRKQIRNPRALAQNRWHHMMNRCYNVKDKQFRHYGGRGISVCERWHVFENFYVDMGDRPSPNHTLDRADNSKGYGPDNCQWATWEHQNRNRRYARMLEFNGERMCAKDWAIKLGMQYTTLHERIRRGWPIDKALTIPSSASNSNLNLRTRTHIKPQIGTSS